MLEFSNIWGDGIETPGYLPPGRVDVGLCTTEVVVSRFLTDIVETVPVKRCGCGGRPGSDGIATR
jgi:hypothetical protein